MKALTTVIAAAALAGAASFAGAEAQEPERVSAPVAAPAAWESTIRSLPEYELKRLYGECNRLAERRALANEHVLACSVAYDALLVGAFGGDYLALRAWAASGEGQTASAMPGQ